MTQEYTEVANGRKLLHFGNGLKRFIRRMRPASEHLGTNVSRNPKEGFRFTVNLLSCSAFGW